MNPLPELRRFNRQFARPMNDLVYGTLSPYLAPVLFLAAAFTAFQAIEDPGKSWVLPIALFVYALLFTGAAIAWRRLDRLRVEQIADPLGTDLIVLDYVDAQRLLELAGQLAILPAPTRRERSRGSKRSMGLGLGKGAAQSNVSHEATVSESDVYEMPENHTELLRDLLRTLAREQKLDLGIADVPTVSVNAPLDEKEIEALLIRELGHRNDPLDLRTVAREAASILGRDLPPERLATAKKRELEGMEPGAYALVESQWSAVPNGPGGNLRLTLAALCPRSDSEKDSKKRVPMPEGLEVSVDLSQVSLGPRAQARLKGDVQASIFGEILGSSNGQVALWPITIFLRTPDKTRQADD